MASTRLIMYRDLIDVMEQAGDRVDTILVPKVGVPADLYLCDALMSQIEMGKGFKASRSGSKP